MMNGAGLPCVLCPTASSVYVRLHGPDHQHMCAGSSRGGLLIDIAVGICGSIVGGYLESRLELDLPGNFEVSVPNLLL